MTCILVAMMISCSGQKLATTPAEAAALMAPHQFVYVAKRVPRIHEPDLSSSPTAGPFGEFKPFSPARRLDGSLFTDPPWTLFAYTGKHGYTPPAGATIETRPKVNLGRETGRPQPK